MNGDNDMPEPLAAAAVGVPLFLNEQNAASGRANRMFGIFPAMPS